MIQLVPIDSSNWRVKLNVKPEQETFVANKVSIMARAYAYRHFRSNAYFIYCDNITVGIGLYYDDESSKAYILSQMFIDQNHQNKGYGLLATQLIIEKLKHDGKYNKVLLCYVKGNDAAKMLYQRVGFYLTDNSDGDEIIMQLDI